MASHNHLDDDDDFGGDFSGNHYPRRSGGKRSFGDIEDDEDDLFGSKKANIKGEDNTPGAATGMIISLRESLQNCKETLATCEAELESANAEIHKWHSAFQNESFMPLGASPEPRFIINYLQTLKSSEESLREQLEKAKKKEAAFIVTFAKREQEIAELKVMDGTSPNRGKTTVPVKGNLTPKHFRWTYEMECHFLDLLMHEDRLGNRVGGAFTPQAYRNILGDMQATFGLGIQKNHLKNKIRTMKQQYNEFKDAFRGMSGFSWNLDTKKFEAENKVWESLIKDNPSAASLQGKRCLHWENMNTLWSSSRAVGFTSATFPERCARLDARFTSMSYNASYQSTSDSNSASNHNVSGSPSLANATSNQAMSDVSSSQPSASSGKAKSKRKAAADVALESVGKNIASSMEHLFRAIVESADILANKVPHPHANSADLFTAVLSLDLPKDYLFECYEFLSMHNAEANMFLGTTQQYRVAMLTRIMKSR